jgi:hypothetical protein
VPAGEDHGQRRVSIALRLSAFIKRFATSRALR